MTSLRGILGSCLFSLICVVGASAQRPGQVISADKISAVSGGFVGPIQGKGDFFARSATAVGDLDGNGVVDLAVSAPGFDTGSSTGAIWILFRDREGRVQSEHRITDENGVIGPEFGFGGVTTSPGDLDGDGIFDLAYVAGPDWLWVLFLDTDGTVKSFQRSPLPAAGGFVGGVIGAIGDLNDDGIPDLAVGNTSFILGVPNDPGRILILFMDGGGGIRGSREISNDDAQVLPLVLPSAGNFGSSVTGLGDIDGDGVDDIAVGSLATIDFVADQILAPGRVYVLLMRRDGSVKAATFVDETDVGLNPFAVSAFGIAVAGLGDLNSDGVADLAVGASDAFLGRGTVRILMLERDGDLAFWHGLTEPPGGLDHDDAYGRSLSRIDPSSCGVVGNLVVAADGDDDGGDSFGAVYVVTYHPTGTWKDLGGGIAGTNGLPSLTGLGTQLGSQSAALRLRQGRPNSRAFMIAGRGQIDAPFKGGTLVPFPHSVLPPVDLDGSGTHVFEVRWPACMPSGTAHYWQVWIQDPATSAGWAASNALESRTR